MTKEIIDVEFIDHSFLKIGVNFGIIHQQSNF